METNTEMQKRRVWENRISEPNICRVTRIYNNGQQFGLFINHDISILEIIMAKSYALAFPWQFILQGGDLLLHAIQANSLASSEEYKLLAVLSQFLVEKRHCCNQYFTLMISIVLQYATPEQLFRRYSAVP